MIVHIVHHVFIWIFLSQQDLIPMEFLTLFTIYKICDGTWLKWQYEGIKYERKQRLCATWMALPISIRMWLLMDTHFLTLSNNNFISFMIYLIYQWSAYDILLYSTHYKNWKYFDHNSFVWKMSNKLIILCDRHLITPWY